MPTRMAEAWVNKQINLFGSVAESAPFKRVAAMLTTSRGRVKILGCVEGKVPLECKGSETGIEECALILQEMSKVRAGGGMGESSPAEQTTAGSSDARVEIGDTPDAGHSYLNITFVSLLRSRNIGLIDGSGVAGWRLAPRSAFDLGSAVALFVGWLAPLWLTSIF